MSQNQSKQKQPPLGQEHQTNRLSSVPPPQETTLSTPSQRDETAMKKAHFVLQKRGGLGKTVTASWLAQYVISIGEGIEIIDTDPSNATLSSFKALKAQHVQLMEGTVLNEARFDLMMNRVLEEDSNFLIDCGASSFIPLNNYMIENKVVDMILQSGKEVYVHIVIAGESHLIDTLSGFAEMAEQLPEQVKIIVWLNQHFGKIEADGKPFEEMNIYLENQDRVHGIVVVPKKNPATFGVDVEKMLKNHLTFDEVKHSPEFFVMNKSRIFQVKQDIYAQLKEIL
jgi:hypothetical protein